MIINNVRQINVIINVRIQKVPILSYFYDIDYYRDFINIKTENSFTKCSILNS